MRRNINALHVAHVLRSSSMACLQAYCIVLHQYRYTFRCSTYICRTPCPKSDIISFLTSALEQSICCSGLSFQGTATRISRDTFCCVVIQSTRIYFMAVRKRYGESYIYLVVISCDILIRLDVWCFVVCGL